MSSSSSRGAWLASACALVAVLALIVPSRADSESASSAVRPAQAGYIDAGIQHTCAILADHTLRCWGKGLAGRLGYGSDASILSAAAAPPVNLGAGRYALAVAAGDFHTCAILDDHNVKCWGFGANGRLGYGSTANLSLPAAAPPVNLGRGAVAITAGTSHTCAILDDGSVRCWGNGSDGRLGYGNTQAVGDDEVPAVVGPVNLGGRTARAIAAGAVHTCAILDDGSIRCWGFGANGRLGYGSQSSLSSPGGAVPIGAGRTAIAIGAGDAHSCAVLDTGGVRCWGFGGGGRLGYATSATVGDAPGSLPDSAGPVALGPGRTARGITLGGAPTPTTPAAPDEGTGYTCALIDDGTLRCWGYGVDGRLGYGDQAQVAGTGFPTPGAKGPVPLGPLAGSLADLSVGVAASASQVPLNGSAGLAVRVSNGGPDAAGVAVSIPPAAGLTYTAAGPSQGSFNGATGRWEVGGLAPGATASLQLTGRLGAAGAHEIAAQLAASSIPDRLVGDDRAAVAISVPAGSGSGKALKLRPRGLGMKVVRFPKRGRATRLTVSGVLTMPRARPAPRCRGVVQVRALAGKRLVGSTKTSLRRRKGACRYTAVLRPKAAKVRAARVL